MAFTFPTDTNNKPGAVRANADGTTFHLPVVLYSPDGTTPLLTSANPGVVNVAKIGGVTVTGDPVHGIPVDLTRQVYPAAAATTHSAAQTADEFLVAAAAGLRLLGFSAQETAGAMAKLVVKAGSSALGDARVLVSLAPNESARDWYGPYGLDCASGIFIDRVSGTSEITVHWIVL